MIKLLVLLTLLISFFILVSCSYNISVLEPLESFPIGINVIQSGNNVEIFATMEILGIELELTYKNNSNTISFNDNLLGITNLNGEITRIAIVGYGNKIKKGEKLFTINNIKLTEITFLSTKIEEDLKKSFNNEKYVTGISLNDISLEKNQQGYILIHAKNITGIKSFEFFVEYDSMYIVPDKNSTGDVSFVNFLGAFSGGMSIIKEENSIGTKKIIRIAGVLNSPINISDDDIIKINFISLEQLGNSTINFTNNSVVKNINYSTIYTIFTQGTVSIFEQLQVLLGDFDLNGEVGLSDFILFSGHYGCEVGNDKYLIIYDISPAEDRYGGDWEGIYDFSIPDGKINLLDFIIFGNNYGFKIPNVNNSPPSIPIINYPQDGQIDMNLTLTISWHQASSQRNLSTLYDLYFDTNPNPTTKIASNISTTYFYLSGLSYSTTYYCKIVAKNDYGQSVGGPWSFKTINPSVSEKTYRAITLGLTTYDAGVNNLNYTDDDSNDLEIVLSNLNEDYIVEKHTGRVTEVQAKDYLDNYILQSNTFTSSDVLIFHYSGHGGYDSGGSYMYMSDGGKFYASELRTKLDLLSGTKIILIDACESGNFLNLNISKKNIEYDSTELSNQFNNNIIEIFSENIGGDRSNYNTPYEYYIMASSSIDEYSSEDFFLKNGYFSFFLFDGLGDVGVNNHNSLFDKTYDADINYNQSITFSELFNYTKQGVLGYCYNQTVQGYPINSDFIIGNY